MYFKHSVTPTQPNTTLSRANERLLEAQARKRHQQNGGGVACRGKTRPLTSLIKELVDVLPEPQPQATGTSQSEFVKLYPTIGMAALGQKKTGCLRLWLWLRYLDPKGSGKTDLPALRAFLSEDTNQIRGVSWSQTRKLLRAGNNRYWQLPYSDGRPDYKGSLFYRSPARVAAELGIYRLFGLPVNLPVKTLQSLKQFNAELYHAFHSGRKHKKPISQQTIYRLYGIPERTQRHYRELTELKHQQNLAVDARNANQTALQDATWKYSGVFAFFDQDGRQGRKNRQLIAWRIPNSYQGSLSAGRYGNQRKINRKLENLAHMARLKGDRQGNANEPIDRLFFDDGKQAGKAYNRQPDLDRYWQSNNRTTTGKLAIWHVLAGFQDDSLQR